MAKIPPAGMVDTEVKANVLPVDYWQSLDQYVEEEREEPPLGQFGRLQIMNLTHLLNEIVRIKGAVERNRTTSADQMECLRNKLQQYGKHSRKISHRNMSKEPLLADPS